MTDTRERPLVDFMDLLLDAVCVVNAEGRFVFASAACQQIFGYTPEEMLGRNMLAMVLPEDQDKTQAMAQRVLAGERLRESLPAQARARRAHPVVGPPF